MSKKYIKIGNKRYPVEQTEDEVFIFGVKIDRNLPGANMEEIYKKISEDSGIHVDIIFKGFAKGWCLYLKSNKFKDIVSATNHIFKK